MCKGGSLVECKHTFKSFDDLNTILPRNKSDVSKSHDLVY